ncbi:MAG: glycosyltransferase family 2 protein [Streptococcus sp.]
MKPLLTVVIPVYNVEKYLKRCIESILIQEWKNYDILLVDDGSTDNSPKWYDYVKS